MLRRRRPVPPQQFTMPIVDETPRRKTEIPAKRPDGLTTAFTDARRKPARKTSGRHSLNRLRLKLVSSARAVAAGQGCGDDASAVIMFAGQAWDHLDQTG